MNNHLARSNNQSRLELIQKLKENSLKKLIIKVYKEEKHNKLKREEVMKNLCLAKRNRDLFGIENDTRVDKTIFCSYDDQRFLNYYENKLGITSESVNPFVNYKLTENDYENMLEKVAIKNLKSKGRKSVQKFRSRNIIFNVNFYKIFKKELLKSL